MPALLHLDMILATPSTTTQSSSSSESPAIRSSVRRHEREEDAESAPKWRLIELTLTSSPSAVSIHKKELTHTDTCRLRTRGDRCHHARGTWSWSGIARCGHSHVCRLVRCGKACRPCGEPSFPDSPFFLHVRFPCHFQRYCKHSHSVAVLVYVLYILWTFFLCSTY
jgi:hypothetical protein